MILKSYCVSLGEVFKSGQKSCQTLYQKFAESRRCIWSSSSKENQILFQELGHNDPIVIRVQEIH